MAGYKKGVRTREEIILTSREILNVEGLNLTLAVLAKRMQTSLGRITYHFPTKEMLYLAIGEDFQMRQQTLRASLSESLSGLKYMVELANHTLDLQYSYRCAIQHLASSSRGQKQDPTHMVWSYLQDVGMIKEFVEAEVKNGVLDEKILDPETYSVFQFKFTNLFTTWVISYEIIDIETPYTDMKKVYMKGIFSSFDPFLTEKGKAILNEFGL